MLFIYFQIEDYTENGSGWCLLNLVSLDIGVISYNPLNASSYIPLPKSIASKKGCINVQNKDDNKCFTWAILSALADIPRSRKPERLSHYIEQEESLNMHGIPYPVPITSIPRFERLNDTMSINVYALRWDQADRRYKVDPVYITPQKKMKHINLLYISDKKNNNHYVWIKNMSALLHGQLSRHTGKLHICDRCLHSSTSERTLRIHEERCQEHRAQRSIFPKPNTKLKFEKVMHQHPVDFFFVADLESVLQRITTVPPDPTSTSSTTPIANHLPCECSYKVMSTDPRFYQPSRVFVGESCVEQLIEAMQDDARKLSKILDVNVPHNIPDDERRRMIDTATKCYLCACEAAPGNHFVLDHNHLTGKMRFYLFIYF